MKATDQIEFKTLNKMLDKLKEFDAKHGWIDYFIAPLFVTIILLIVYAIKGVYPFGINTIAYYDMPTNGLASYTRLYDILHGKSGWALNWNVGLGASAAGGSLFNPINLFFLFVNRDGILYAVSYFLMIKLALIAFSMSFYIKKRYGNTVIVVCSGILYSFCGYVLQYYTNIDFIDLTFVLPLLVYALERLLIEHKQLLFTVLMFFVYMCNVQLVFMVCLYLIFKSYFILKSVDEEKKGKSIRLFAISAITSALMAGFVLIPSVLALSKSVRVTKGASGSGESFDYIEQMRYVYNIFRRQKQFMIYGGEIAVGLLLYLFLKGRETIRRYSDNIVMISIVALPILHEGINLLWHAGSYKHFPVRFGYMITFECLVFLAKFCHENEFYSIKYIGRAAKLIGTAAIPFVAYVLFKFAEEFTESGIGDSSPYHTYWLYLITLASMYFIIFLMDSDPTRNSLLIVLVLIQGFCGCYGFIAPKTASIEQYRVRYALNSVALRNEYDKECIPTERIKMDPADYDPNDSFIVGQPTISYWSYGINGATEDVLQYNMEYDGMPTCTLDSGGTVFTDALLGVKYAAALNEPDKTLYTKDEKRNGVYFCNYTMPFGLVLDKTEIEDESKGFEYQNNLFKEITGIDEKLINIKPADTFILENRVMTDEEIRKVNDIFVKYGPKDAYNITSNEESTDDGNADVVMSEVDVSVDTYSSVEDDNSTRRYILNIPGDDKTILYLFADTPFDNDMSVMINGRPVYTNSFESYGHFDYPNEIFNGILCLGSIDNNKTKLDIHTTNKDLKGINIGFLDLNILERGIEEVKKNQDLNIECGKNSMHVTGFANRSGTLFLPIGYSKNWNARLNGKHVNVKPYINGAFIAVDVPKGDINLELTYRLKGFIPGIALSALGLIMCIGLIIFEKHGGFAGRKCEPVLDKVFVYGFNSLVAAMFIVMYIVPIWIKMSL